MDLYQMYMRGELLLSEYQQAESEFNQMSAIEQDECNNYD